MELPSDVNVYKMGFAKEVYRDATQYQACEKSIKQLQVQMQTEDENEGQGFKALLQERIDSARRQMANLEAKYANWTDPTAK